MAVRYFAGTRPLVTGRFLIHREGCPLMPEDNEFIGSFKNANEALNSSPDKCYREPCLFCCKEQPPNRDSVKYTVLRPALITAVHFSNENGFLPGTFIN